MPIKIEFTADTPDDLHGLIRRFSELLSQTTPALALHGSSDIAPGATKTVRTVAVVDAPKAPAEDPAPEDDEPELSALDREPDDEAPAAPSKRGRPKGARNKPKPVEPDPVSAPAASGDAALSSADAIKTAVSILSQLYGRGSEAQDKIRALQRNYGVQKFADLPGDQAHKLLADARAIAAELDKPKAADEPVDF